ncbi:PucR family transcriptional regulator ligand-binding domain-containing protein [Leucobacter ruminantium]|uniref:PucR family transcriptional regulator ligand-binding domain-containing protein n=1 Tax=Leucobacter ruminantium TaxID=1289170 RepID=A0A939RXC3_9MICO|nr:PucR family transcriptional regulator ligand-binding domain-containing protein [Leucobacter ruminantium]MBO1805957.1 PucR family transcriptional regulator ligand-binding domain-containing protein [Leucobacter ruminantium]
MADAGLTVGEIAAIDTLRTEVLAGAGGLGRRVVWAHSCELEEPWQWLGPAELLLTVGFCVPRDPEAQVGFVRRLVEAGIAGASIGVRGGGAELSDDMLREAERLDFPLLRTDAEVPWSAITRHVAAASDSLRAADVLTLAKLYGLTASVEHPQDLLLGVAELLGAGVAVIDRASGRRLLTAEAATPGRATPGRSEPEVDSGEAAPPPLRVRRHGLARNGDLDLELEIAEHPERPLSAMVLVHVKRLVEVEADRALLRLAARQGDWNRALERALGAGDPCDVAAMLGEGVFRAVVVERSALVPLARAAVLQRTELVAGVFGGRGVVFVAEERLGELRSLAADRGATAGASAPFSDWG